jgi:hypothetical protein
MESVYSKRIRAGKRRTYFFDVRETRGNDFYLTITESRKRFDGEGYDRHKIFLYKEDFNKFVKGLSEAVDYVKTELMPDFDFDAFNHEYPENGEDVVINGAVTETNHTVEPSETAEVAEPFAAPAAEEISPVIPETNHQDNEEVDKW